MLYTINMATKRKKIISWLVLTGIIVVALISLELNVYFEENNIPAATSSPMAILSFKDCLIAGYPVLKSYPRQCKTADGRTYVEEIPEKITYINANADMIVPTLPFPGAVTGKQFQVTGKARGTWYFEASFPVEIIDANGKILASGPAQATEDWMTTEFVPFNATMTVPASYVGKATVVLKKDNPSGMPERDASISFPITIEY